MPLLDLITTSKNIRVTDLSTKLREAGFYSNTFSIISNAHSIELFDDAIELLNYIWLERHPSNDPVPKPENYKTIRQAFEEIEEFGKPLLEPFRVEGLYRISEILVYEGNFPLSMNYVHSALHLSKQIASEQPLASLGVRFFQTRSGNLTQVGQLVTEPEYFLKTGRLGWHNHKLGMFCVPDGKCANKAALSELRKEICVITDEWLCHRLGPLAKRLEAQTFFFELPNNKIEWQWSGVLATQSVWEGQGRSPIFSLNSAAKHAGMCILESLGIPKNAWFVALHVREEKPKGNDGGTPLRNAQINSYIPAIKAITDRGGWVVRMGGPSMTKLDPLPQVIDYAHARWRTDWLDLFFCSEARFFLGTALGLCGLPMWYGTPMIFTNTCPFNSYPPSSKDLYIPKLFRDKKSQKYIPFSESVTPPLRNCYDPFHLDRLGIQLVDNTPEEIAEVVEEMFERTENPECYSQEQNELQKIFCATVSHYEPLGLRMRIGSKFLERYKFLLP